MAIFVESLSKLHVDLVPDRDPVVAVRKPSEVEASGRAYLTRATITATVGGVILAVLSSGVFSDVTELTVGSWGMLVGLAIMALALVATVELHKKKMLFGAAIIVLAILSMPIAFGGFVVAALCAIVGGAMFVAYEPPVGELVVLTTKGNYIRRGVALLVDFLVAFGLYVALIRLLPGGSQGHVASVLISWCACWLLVAVVPAVWFRRTPGRLIISLRVADMVSGGRAEGLDVLWREVVRGFISVGCFLIIMRVILAGGGGLRIWHGLIMTFLVVACVWVAEYLQLVDQLTKTISAHDQLIHRRALGSLDQKKSMVVG